MKRILIVDDEPAILETLPRALHLMCDFQGEIGTAANGGEAVLKAGDCFYDLCMLEVKLPDISGFALMKSIREIYPDTNIILMSERQMWNQMNTIIAEGDAFFIRKPFNFLQMKNILKKALGEKRTCADDQFPAENETMEKRMSKRRQLMKRVSFILSEINHIEFTGGAIDISYQGMGLKTYCPLERGDVLKFTDGIGHKLGIVSWSKKLGEDHYRAGVKFK